jgi:hypothetical protein
MAISGAACSIQNLSSGEVIGRATNVSVNQTTEQFPVKILGNIDTEEHEPVDRNVTLSASSIRIRNNSLFQQQIFPRGGTNEVISFQPMDWAIVDAVQNVVLWRLIGVVGESHSWSLDRGSIMMYNCSFRALRMLDEQD